MLRIPTPESKYTPPYFHFAKQCEDSNIQDVPKYNSALYIFFVRCLQFSNWYV